MKILIYVPIMAAVLQYSTVLQCAAQNISLVELRANDKPPDTSYLVYYPSTHNIQRFRVVLINGFGLGTSMIALGTVGTLARPKYPQFDMQSGDFYTNAYRWALRAISLIPEWASGKGANYADSQKVWRKRFYYMDEQVPDWLKSLLYYVDDWEREDWAKARYTMYAKPSFDKHLRFPSRVATDNFDSFRQTKETVENLDDSAAETPKPRSLYWGPHVAVHYDKWHYKWGPFGKK